MIGGAGFNLKHKIKECDQAALFKKYFEVDPDLGRRYFSIFREDNHGDCRFEMIDGVLFFVDNAGYNGKIYFNIYSALKEIGLSHSDILKLLSKKGVTDIPESEGKRAEIEIGAIPWEKGNRFEVYGLDADFLNNDPHTFDVLAFSINGRLINQRATGYVCNNHVKLRTIDHHINNFEVDDIMNVGYLDRFSKDIIGIIKAKKDALVVEKHLNIPSLIIYNERVILPDWAIDIAKTYNDVFVFMDNDKTGRESAAQYRKRYGFRSVFTEEKHITDLIDKKGLDYGIETLKNII